MFQIVGYATPGISLVFPSPYGYFIKDPILKSNHHTFFSKQAVYTIFLCSQINFSQLLSVLEDEFYFSCVIINKKQKDLMQQNFFSEKIKIVFSETTVHSSCIFSLPLFQCWDMMRCGIWTVLSSPSKILMGKKDFWINFQSCMLIYGQDCSVL